MARVARRLTWRKKALFSLLSTGLALGLLEAALALLGVQTIRETRDPFVGFEPGESLFEPVTEPGNPPRLRTREAKLRFFNAQDFPRDKPPNSVRVFALGGSTTYGRPYRDPTSFAGWLRELLPRADPSRHWEVINAGGISYASYRVALLQEELLAYSPDLFVVYTGHNEFLEQRTYPEGATPGWLERTRRLASRTRLYSAIERLVSPSPSATTDPAVERLPGEVTAILDSSVGPSSYHRDDALSAQVLDHFRFNLRRMVDLAEAVGARIVFVKPASNLRDCSPFKSEPGSGLDNETLARAKSLRDVGERALAAGSLEASLSALRESCSLDPRHARGHWSHGRALLASGQPLLAKAAFERARDEDVCALRAPGAFVEAVEEVARERSVPLVDFESIAHQRAVDGIPGEDLFLDHVHPTIAMHRELALSILDTLEGIGLFERATTWGPDAIEAATLRIETGIDREEHAIALKNLSKVLAWAGKFDEAHKLAERAVRELPDDAEAQFQLAFGLEKSGDLAAAARAYEAVVSIDPSYHEAWKNLGRLAHRRGDLSEAIRLYRRSLEIAPDVPEARVNLAKALRRLDRADEAERELRAILARSPDDVPALHELGAIELARSRPEAAAVLLERAARLAPADAQVATNLGVALADSGRAREAESAYRRALDLDPGRVLAHDNLANLLAAEGRIDEALEHFQMALLAGVSSTDDGAAQVELVRRGIEEKLRVMAGRYTRIASARPEDLEARLHLSVLRILLGDPAGREELRIVTGLAKRRQNTELERAGQEWIRRLEPRRGAGD